MKQHVLEVLAVGQAFPKEFTAPYSSSFLTPEQGPKEAGSSHWHRIFFPGMGRVTAAVLESSQCRPSHRTCSVGKFLILSMQGEWFHRGKKAAVGTQKSTLSSAEGRNLACGREVSGPCCSQGQSKGTKQVMKQFIPLKDCKQRKI